MARISVTQRISFIAGAIFSRAAIAAGASLRATKNSLWISSPALGVNSILKCGKRICHGPLTAICSVQGSGFKPGKGCRLDVAGYASNNAVGAVVPDLNFAQTSPPPAAAQVVK